MPYCTADNKKAVSMLHCFLPSCTNVTLTIDTASFITVIRTVVHFITLFGAVNTGSISALELIGLTYKQGWGTQTTHTHALELGELLHYYCSENITYSDTKLEAHNTSTKHFQKHAQSRAACDFSSFTVSVLCVLFPLSDQLGVHSNPTAICHTQLLPPQKKPGYKWNLGRYSFTVWRKPIHSDLLSMCVCASVYRHLFVLALSA